MRSRWICEILWDRDLQLLKDTGYMINPLRGNKPWHRHRWCFNPSSQVTGRDSIAIEYGCEGHPSPYGAEWSTQKIPMVIVFVMKVAISWAKDECFLRLPSICPICPIPRKVTRGNFRMTPAKGWLSTPIVAIGQTIEFVIGSPSWCGSVNYPFCGI